MKLHDPWITWFCEVEMFIKTEKISGVNSKNSVADSKYRGLLDQTSKVTLIFENVGSKVYSVGRILH